MEQSFRRQKWKYLQLIKYYERAGYACNIKLERRLTTGFFNWRNKLIDSQRWYRHKNPQHRSYKYTIAVLHDKYVWPRQNYKKSLHKFYLSKKTHKVNQHFFYKWGNRLQDTAEKRNYVEHLQAQAQLIVKPTQKSKYRLNNRYNIQRNQKPKMLVRLRLSYWWLLGLWTWSRYKQYLHSQRVARSYSATTARLISKHLRYGAFRYRKYRQLRLQVTGFLLQQEERRVQGLVYGQQPYVAVQRTRKWADFVSEYKQGLYRLALYAHRVWKRPVDWSKPIPWVFHWQPIDEIFQEYTNEIFDKDRKVQQDFLQTRRKWTPIWQFMARGYRVGDIAYRWPSEYPKRSYFYRPIWRRPFAFIEYREWKRHVYYHRHVWTRFMRTKKYDWKTKYGGVFLRRWNYEHGLYQGQVLLMDQFTGIPAHDVLLDQRLWGAQTAKSGFKTVGSQSKGSWRWAHPRDAWFSGRQAVPGYFGHLRFHKIFFQTLGWETYAKRTAHFRSILQKTNGQRWVLARYEKAYRDKLVSRPLYLKLEHVMPLAITQHNKLHFFYQRESLHSTLHRRASVVIPFLNSEYSTLLAYPDEFESLSWFSIKAIQAQSQTFSRCQADSWGSHVFMACGKETLYIYNPMQRTLKRYALGDRGELTHARWFQEFTAKRWKDLGRLQIPQELLRLRSKTTNKQYNKTWEQIPTQRSLDPTFRVQIPAAVNNRIDRALWLYSGSFYLQLLNWEHHGATALSNIEHHHKPVDNVQLYKYYNTRLKPTWQNIFTHVDKEHYGEFVLRPTALNYGSWSENRLTTARSTYWNSASIFKRRTVLIFLLAKYSPYTTLYLYQRRLLWLLSLIPPAFDDPHWHTPIRWQHKHFPEHFTWQRYFYIQIKHRLLDLQPGNIKRIINLYPIYWQNFFSKPRGIYRICPWGVHKEWPARTQTNYTRGARYEPILDFWQYYIHFCARDVIAYLMWCHERLPRYPTGTRNRGMLPVRHEVYWKKLFLHLRKYKIPTLIDEDLPPWVPWGIIFYSGGVKNWLIVGQETMQPGWICLKENAFIEFGVQHGLIYAGTYGRHYAPMVYAGFTHGFVVGITALRSKRARFWADYEVHLVYTNFHRKYSQHFRAQFFETDMPETGSFGLAKRLKAWHSWIPIFGSRIRYWNFLAQCTDYADWEPSCVWGRTRAHYDLIYWKLTDSFTHGGYGIEVPQYSYRFDSSKRERDFFNEKLIFNNLNSRGLILYKDKHKNLPQFAAPQNVNKLLYLNSLASSPVRQGYAGQWVHQAWYQQWINYLWSIEALNRTSETRRKEKFPRRVRKMRKKLGYQSTKMRLRHRFRHLEPIDYQRAKLIFIKCLDSPKVWAGIEVWFSEWFNESLFDYQIDRVVERLKPFVERQRDPTRGLYEINPHYWMCHNSGRAVDEFADAPYWKEEFYQTIRLILFLHVAEGYHKLYSQTPKKNFADETLAAADAHIFGREAIKSSAMWIGLLLHESSGKSLLRIHETQWYWRRKHFISLLGRLVYGKEPRIHRSESVGCSDWEFLFENFDRWYKRDLDWKRDQEYRRVNHNFPYQHPRHYKRTLRKKVNKWG